MKLHSAKTAISIFLLFLLCFTTALKYGESSAEKVVLNLIPDKQMLTSTSLLDALIADSETPEAIPVTADAALPDLLLPGSTAPESESGEIVKSEKPLKILLYHTHATEAYRQDGLDIYQESGSYRTKDNSKNIVAIGEVLRQELESLGFTVIHDTTNNEPPKLATAYTRSLETMQKYDQENIDIYIDIHRDASGSANLDDVVTIGGERCARMMFVVGNGLKKNGSEYSPKPNFENTYAFADAVMKNVLQYHENFMREIRVKNGRYNQHLSDYSLLIEVGHNMNTLQEAKNSMKYFAKALYKTVIA